MKYTIDKLRNFWTGIAENPDYDWKEPVEDEDDKRRREENEEMIDAGLIDEPSYSSDDLEDMAMYVEPTPFETKYLDMIGKASKKATNNIFMHISPDACKLLWYVITHNETRGQYVLLDSNACSRLGLSRNRMKEAIHELCCHMVLISAVVRGYWWVNPVYIPNFEHTVITPKQ
jgi:hypothetical protein